MESIGRNPESASKIQAPMIIGVAFAEAVVLTRSSSRSSSNLSNMELLDKFGINFSVLLAQAVNFLIVLVVLYRFAYKPILKILHDRTRTIETSLKNAEKFISNLEKRPRKRIVSFSMHSGRPVQ